jgi:hypothetical protein
VCILHKGRPYEKENANHDNGRTKKKMDDAKDFYGGYSGLIEKALKEFLVRPVEKYKDDIININEAKQANEWIELEELKRKLQQQ